MLTYLIFELYNIYYTEYAMLMLLGQRGKGVGGVEIINPWTTDIQRKLFFKNSKFFGLGRQIWLTFYEAFWVFLAKL